MSQTIQEPFTEYITIIQNLTAVAGSIARTEETKTAAVSARKHEILDDCIQEEQALLLKLRGLEQHRTRLQQTLGWEDLTLRQILDAASPEQTEALTQPFQKLDQQLRRLQTAREASERILKVRLHELEVFSQMGASYDNGGNVSQNNAPQGTNRIRDTYV